MNGRETVVRDVLIEARAPTQHSHDDLVCEAAILFGEAVELGCLQEFGGVGVLGLYPHQDIECGAASGRDRHPSV